MVFKKWRLRPANKALAKQLAEECDIDPLVALIATAREYTDPMFLEEFLSSEPILSSPYELQDIEKAALRINRAVELGEKIAIFGDYDCDGITATVLLYSYLQDHGADVMYYIPSREKDGYGINADAVTKLAGQGVKLIVTVDNGIHAVEEARQAAALGVDFIVTDHHLPKEEIPVAYAVVDPYISEGCSFKAMAGVGVVFKLLCVLEQAEPEELLQEYADIVSIGTVADVMPLLEDNRSIVKAGLEKINSEPRMGIRALLEVAGLSGKKLTAGNMAFTLTPRLNASGRMGDANRAVELLLAEDYNMALQLAKELNDENTNRQKTEQQILKEAVKDIEARGWNYDRVIVVSGAGWHHGVIGIVASRITELYGKPAIVLSVEEGVASGSGRSISGFHLFDALNSVSGYLERFGGHELAAGLSLYAENIAVFREQINAYARKVDLPVAEVALDCKLNPAALSTDFVKVLADLEPFGAGNPTPVFGLFEMRLEKIQEIGEGKHLRLNLSKNGTPVQVMVFGKNKARFGYAPGSIVDLAVGLGISEYGGKESLSIVLKDIRVHGRDDDALIQQSALFDDYKRDRISPESAAQLVPDRQELGTVFRFIHAFNVPVPEHFIINSFLLTISPAKIGVIFDILCELGVLGRKTTENGVFYDCPAEARKNNMENSVILQKLNALKDVIE